MRRGSCKDEPNSTRGANTASSVAVNTVLVPVMAIVAAIIIATSRFEAGISLTHSEGVDYRGSRENDNEDLRESHSGNVI
ncbi:hypothetical protein HAV15_011181 [Penicillium sp. str. |nr:hypothetical protein HAV15_011181 [Penicillium sp. str. \